MRLDLHVHQRRRADSVLALVTRASGAFHTASVDCGPSANAEEDSRVWDVDADSFVINLVDERPVQVHTLGRLAPSLKVSLLKEPTFGGGIRTAAPSLKTPKRWAFDERFEQVAAESEAPS